MKKIYFAGSIRGGRKDAQLYLEIIEELKKYGEVLTEHVGDQNLTDTGKGDPLDSYIYERDMKWLREADIVIAEVTTPSLGVGYEIAMADNMGKQAVSLFRGDQGKISAMITGRQHFSFYNYKDISDLSSFLEKFFSRIPFL